MLVEGNASTGLAENIMSGVVRITGNATMSAGATGCGGVVVVRGNAGARCGISMKGVDIVVGGNVGHMSAFMAQAGRLVVCGDAAADLGDSIYEAQIFVRGDVESLGADCIEKEIRPEHLETLARLLAAAARRRTGPVRPSSAATARPGASTTSPSMTWTPSKPPRRPPADDFATA